VVITIYALKGMQAFPQTITIIQAIAGSIIAVVALVQLINKQQLFLLSEPVFWIAGGCFCYFGMSGFMEALTDAASAQMQEEKTLILIITNVTRFAFFTVATYVAPAKVSSQEHHLQ
jgi:putative Ca2+/H+ antiporter (TMEM165/GDT1 family)